MRFKTLQLDDLSERQRAILRDIKEGPRGAHNPERPEAPRGLFGVMIRAPGLADPAQQVGAYLRYGSSVEPRISEFVIIITARYWNSRGVWTAHCKQALKAGLDAKTAEELGQNRKPTAMKEDEAAAYRFCAELHQTKSVSDETFQIALRQFGEQGVVDLTGIAGYYTMASMMHNISDAPFPAGSDLPMPA